MRARRPEMQARRCAFFSVNVVARKANRNTPDTNTYVKKFVSLIGWRPALLDVFAGKLDYPRYTFWDRQMIRFIMLVTHGPTDPTAVVEFTDWKRVEAFGRALGDL
jgi:menaquinone-dependent protoporphyrinogen oxidase